MILEEVEKSTENTNVGLRILRSIASDVSVRVDSVALQGLELLVSESTKAIRGHGVEVGGLILGESISPASETLTIAGFVPVGIEHRFGPLFKTSQADIQVFKDAAEKLRGTVIGYFRSQIRSSMLVRDNDIRLLDELFSNQDCCFALIETTVSTPSVLNLHYVPAGGNPVLTARFPLVAPEFAPSAPEPPKAGGNEIDAPEAEQVRIQLPHREVLRADSEQSSSPENRKSNLSMVALAIAGLAAVVLAFFLGTKWRSPSNTAGREIAQVRSTPPVLSLNLQIAAASSGVEIRWNNKFPAVSRASRGLLVLFDGPEFKRIELNSSEVRSGSYSYPARNSKMSAWLTLYQPNGSFSGETKEVLLSVTPRSAQSVQLPVQTSQKKSEQKLSERSKPEFTPVDSSSFPPASRQFLMKEELARPSEPLRTPELPQPPQIKSVSVPTVQPPAIHVLPPTSDRAINYRGSVVSLAPAKLLHQATPSIPSSLSSRLRTEVQLDVAVSIDAAGKVTGSRVVSSRGALAGLLAIEALKAAQFCRFAPATEDGHPVSGNAVLSYRFAPNIQ